METGRWECFSEKEGAKGGETVRAPVLQVALFCAGVTSLHYSGSACSSAWAAFSESVYMVLGTKGS